MKFNDLTVKQKKRVQRNLRMAFVAAGYDIVTGPDQMLRPRGTVEMGGEDSVLPLWNRLRMINMARQGVRNGDSLRALMRQLELNVVGTDGGKATFAFEGGDAVRAAFAKWARHAEFSDGLCFSKVLSLIVDTKFTGGDMVLLFDDGLIEDSGRILAFEPDEIGDVPKEWLQEKFPGAVQRQGRIYNQNGRFVGVTVSRKYRGAGRFKRDPEGVFFLMQDDFAENQDWVMLREVWRFNQGRGVPPVAAPLDSLLDLESVTKFEVQAAMKNCQTLGQVISTMDGSGDGSADDESDELNPELARQAAAAIAGEDGVGADSASTDAAAAADAAADAAEPVEDEVTLDNIRGSGAIFDQLPDGYKMELLDTKRPNPNVEGFVKWLSGRSGAAVGLAKCYANMEATTSYTAFRGEQVMTWPTFEEWQKSLEREVCDWVVRKWAVWAKRRGFLRQSLPEGWEGSVTWSWPTMREVDQKKAAEAKKLMLENGLLLLDELHPGNKREFVRKLGEDVALFREAGLVHPYERASGAGTPGETPNRKEDEDENE